MQPTHKYKVVVADDEPIIRVNLAEILEHAGYDVAADAGDGFQAMNACKKHMPDLVLLDVRMPILDGLAAAHYIFEQQLAGAIVMVTAYHDIDLVKKASACGVAGYLVKPVSEKALLPCLEVALARSRDISELKSEVERARQAMEARKTIERAKGMLTDRHHMSEQEAYDHIRRLSKEQCISLQKVAEMLLLNSF